jgi:predicted dinucleotide-binding enzyme
MSIGIIGAGALGSNLARTVVPHARRRELIIRA